MRSKVENDTSAWLRSIVGKRGRNVDLAEKTIREAKAFTEKEALDDHLIDLIAPDERQLFCDARWPRDYALRRAPGNSAHRWTRRLSIIGPRRGSASSTRSPIPNIAFHSAGARRTGNLRRVQLARIDSSRCRGRHSGAAGAVGTLSVLPINWIGAALLMLGASLFVLEAKFASHGILGTGGTVAMILGALLLVNGPPEVRIHLSTALAVSLPFASSPCFW